MDVDSSNFRTLLPTILACIARSRFVAIDLELSGIPRKSAKAQNKAGSVRGKQSLQQRYAETKAAAERYHILQLGLTCAEEDKEEGKYILRPFNFHLSPLVDKRLKVERDFVFQSDAVDFLQNHQFAIATSFLRGVPHLSWKLEAEARKIAQAEWDREGFADISIGPNDTESFELMRRVREDIENWQCEESPASFINIESIDRSLAGVQSRGLNRYQKRLVHQLIRAEYPDLITVSREEFVQIVPFDNEREAAQRERKLHGFRKTAIAQIGLRWVIEAICKDVRQVLAPDERSEVSTSAFFRDAMVLHQESDEDELGSLDNQGSDLLEGVPMLVGHNLFLDLIYLYACFFESLPDQVEDFQTAIGTIFPHIVDTKYVADDIQKNSPHYNSSLEGIDLEFSTQPSPVIDTPLHFSRYESSAKPHEAGYDSYMTAKALIRISAKLDGTNTNEDLGSSHRADLADARDLDAASIPLRSQSFAPTSAASLSSSTQIDDNAFSALSIEESGYSLDESDKVRLMMPSVDNNFWTSYSNRLRVNGTAEEVCIIPTSAP